MIKVKEIDAGTQDDQVHVKKMCKKSQQGKKTEKSHKAQNDLGQQDRDARPDVSLHRVKTQRDHREDHDTGEQLLTCI